jgi:formylmethanofuran dehydrogenase subunit E
MIPISIDKLLTKMSKDNPTFNEQETKERMLYAAYKKKNGARCSVCGYSIWAVGSALSGFEMCFPCLMGEDDDSQDYELDTVCETNS